MKKYRKNLALIGFLIIICNLLHSIHPFIVKRTLDIDFSSSNIDEIILGLIIAYVTIHVFFAIFKNIRNILVNKTMAVILKSIREELFNKVLNMKMIYFNKYSSSELYTRLTSDVENLFNLFFGLLNIVINNLIYIAFMVILMFFADVKLAIIGTTTIITITLTVCVFTRMLGKLDNKILEKRDKENKMFSELYNKNKITQLFKLQERNIEKSNKLFDEELKLRRRYIFVHNFPYWLITIIQSVRNICTASVCFKYRFKYITWKHLSCFKLYKRVQKSIRRNI